MTRIVLWISFALLISAEASQAQTAFKSNDWLTRIKVISDAFQLRHNWDYDKAAYGPVYIEEGTKIDHFDWQETRHVEVVRAENLNSYEVYKKDNVYREANQAEYRCVDHLLPILRQNSIAITMLLQKLNLKGVTIFIKRLDTHSLDSDFYKQLRSETGLMINDEGNELLLVASMQNSEACEVQSNGLNILSSSH